MRTLNNGTIRTSRSFHWIATRQNIILKNEEPSLVRPSLTSVFITYPIYPRIEKQEMC